MLCCGSFLVVVILYGAPVVSCAVFLDPDFEELCLQVVLVMVLYILVASVWTLVLRMLFGLSVMMVVVLWHILVVPVWVLVLSMLFWL